MKPTVNRKQADSIIKALEAGVVPRRGIQHLLVGRKTEVFEITSVLERIAAGASDFRLWVGDFGSGKSFMLRTIESIAIQKNFVVASVDLTPQRRFHASDKKAKALYSEIAARLASQSSQDGHAMATIVSRWINRLLPDISTSLSLSVGDLLAGRAIDRAKERIIQRTLSHMHSSLAYEFAQAIACYFQGIATADEVIKIKALRWLTADIETKTESKRELGIAKIIDDFNWYDALKTLTEMLTAMGYAGLVVNFDEAVNLYKLPMARTREKNYEVILNIYNECKSDVVKGLFVNFAATKKTVYDERRGMASYGALKTRFGIDNQALAHLVNTNKTALSLRPLAVEEIYLLLENVLSIYNVHYKTTLKLSTAQIKHYMEEQLNRPGAAEFLTPRAVIKDYLEILDLARQNATASVDELMALNFGQTQRPVAKDAANLDDDIEVI